MAILALGLNLWVTFLLLPALHLREQGLRSIPVLLLGLPLVVLLAGAALRRVSLLLAAYPILLAIPTLVSPKLVGVNVYSPLTFCLAALSFVAYLVISLAVLGTIEAPAIPAVSRDLGPVKLGERWRRRLRIHRALALVCVVFPMVLIFTAFLHPGVQADIERSFPRREAAAGIFIGVLTLVLWLAVFHAYFMLPLRRHVRGDRAMAHQLKTLRWTARRARPRPTFYAFVALALALMLVLVLVHGC